MNAVSPNHAPIAPPMRRPLPAPFSDEPTRQVDDELLTALRNAPPAKPSPKPGLPRPTATQPAAGRPSAIQQAVPPPRQSAIHAVPRQSAVLPAAPDDPTRTALALEDHGQPLGLDGEFDHEIDHGLDELTRPADDFPPRFLPTAPTTEPGMTGGFDDHHSEERTRLASLDSIAAMERARKHGGNEERTRAVNIRNDPSISDIDWDLD
jgi:hypothetical protein